MAGQCIEKIECPKCHKNNLQVFQDDKNKITGYCFSCGSYNDNPYRDKPEGYKPKAFKKKSPEQIKKEIQEIGEYQTLPLPERKLTKEGLEYFNIKIGVSEIDGTTPISHYYPYYKGEELVGWKTRWIDTKKMWGVGQTNDVDLFGWNKAIGAGGKKLFITEGECDAVALYQIFKDYNKGSKYEHLNPPIVSLPHGCGDADKVLSRLLPKIREHFKEIVLVFDNDEAGKLAVENVMKVIPEAVSATLPCKDANECLIQGKGRACYAAVVFNPKKPKNTRIINGSLLHEKAKEPPTLGYSWPWRHLTRATRGMRLGETIYIGAAPKMGKSELVNAITAHCIVEHGWNVFLVKPEESNLKTYKLVAGKMVGKFFHDPLRDFDPEAYDRAGKMIGDNLYMLNLYQHVGWESLRGDIIEAAKNGCKAVIIDPITNLTNGMDAASANVKLQEIAQDLSSLALDLDIIIFIFCHLRNPDQGPPHERGGKVLDSQFAGSRAMARSCNYMFGLEGNRDPDLVPEERNIRKLVMINDREFGEGGVYPLYWDNNTGLFNEI